jgi:hypothetical protein
LPVQVCFPREWHNQYAHASIALESLTPKQKQPLAPKLVATGVYVGAALASVKASNPRKRFLHRHACTK